MVNQSYMRNNFILLTGYWLQFVTGILFFSQYCFFIYLFTSLADWAMKNPKVPSLILMWFPGLIIIL